MRRGLSSLVAIVVLGATGCPGDDTGNDTDQQPSTGNFPATTTTEGETEINPDTDPFTTTEGFDTTEGAPGCDPACSPGETCVDGTCLPDDTGGFDTTGGGGACAAGGTWTVGAASITDPFLHLLFLLLFADAEAMDGSGTEEVTMTASDKGVAFSIAPRDSGSGGGHAGLPEVAGAIDPSDCSFDISGTVPYSSDQGDFGDITASWAGTATTTEINVTLTLEGGGIPSGPIDYILVITPE